MPALVSESDIQRRFPSLSPFLDERLRRLVAAEYFVDVQAKEARRVPA
jgi:hypothetical protein